MFDDLNVSPLKLARTGFYEAGRSSHKPASNDEFREWLGSDVSETAIVAVEMYHVADEPRKLLQAVRKLDLPRERLGRALKVANCNIKVLTHDGETPGSFEWEYVPDVIEQAEPDGTIYMCKSVDAEKAMSVWSENSDNVVVKVDNYTPGEVLGWPRLDESDTLQQEMELI